MSNPKLYLMAGAAGSGKSYVRENNAELRHLPVVDADAHKKKHPDYDPKNPGTVHAWSNAEAKREFFFMLGMGVDFIYDGTGTNAEKYVQFTIDAKSAGYDVEVVYVKVSRETSLKRNAARERNVPEDIVNAQHDTIAISIDIIAGYVDSVRVVKND